MKFLIDILKFPFENDYSKNRFYEVIEFVLVDYPAFLYKKFTIWRILVFPILLIAVIFGYNKHMTK